MELVCFTVWFLVTAATIWDIRRTRLAMQQSVERIAQMTAEVLRRTPPGPA